MTSFSHEVSPMKKAIVAIAVVLISLMCCVWVFGLGGEYPAGEPIGWCPDWPDGTMELLNWEGRVYGCWVYGLVNTNDFHYFAGDTNAFNEFLARYALLKDTPLRLVLHPGRGLISPWFEDKEIPFEWQVSAFSRGWWPEERYPELPTVDEGKSVVMMDLWLGGQVELDKLKVPRNVEVKSGGEIERFIAAHEARQQAQNLSD